MIQITRLLAKQLRAIIRRTLGLTNSMLGQPVKFSTGSLGLRVEATYADFGVRYDVRTPLPQCELIAPLQLLKEVEGNKPEPVTLTRSEDGYIIANWQEGVVPQRWQVPEIEQDKAPVALPIPQILGSNSRTLLEALSAAFDATDPSSSRYALGCIQVRGRQGDVGATDGRQVFRQSGFDFGFEHEVLVRPSTIFAAKELDAFDRVDVGLTDDHMAFDVGPWTIWLPLEKEARFPRVDDVIPRAELAPSTLDIAEADADFLANNLEQLPGGTDQDSPVTVDLNGQVAIRARESDDQPATELVLSNSLRTGDQVCFRTNRSFLLRALKLGFRRFHFHGPESPAVGKRDQRTYVWALLGKEDAVPASRDNISISSPPGSSTTSRRRLRMPKPSAPSVAPIPSTQTAATPVQPPKRRKVRRIDAGVVEQALALRTSLRDVLSKTAELVRSIKRQRKQDRMLRSTLASLKELQSVA